MHHECIQLPGQPHLLPGLWALQVLACDKPGCIDAFFVDAVQSCGGEVSEATQQSVAKADSFWLVQGCWLLLRVQPFGQELADASRSERTVGSTTPLPPSPAKLQRAWGIRTPRGEPNTRPFC